MRLLFLGAFIVGVLTGTLGAKINMSFGVPESNPSRFYVASVSGNAANLLESDYFVEWTTDGGAQLDVTLPPLDNVRGRSFAVTLNGGGNNLVLAGAGGETINTTPTRTIVQDQSALLLFAPLTGTDWKILSYTDGSTIP